MDNRGGTSIEELMRGGGINTNTEDANIVDSILQEINQDKESQQQLMSQQQQQQHQQQQQQQQKQMQQQMVQQQMIKEQQYELNKLEELKERLVLNILDIGEPATIPSNPKKLVIIILSLLSGSLLSIIGVFIYDSLRETDKNGLN